MELILIGISAVIVLLMVSVRYFKIAYAKTDGNSFVRVDNKINSVWSWFRKIFMDTSDDIAELIKDIPHLSMHFLNRIFYRLYKKTKKIVDLIKGKRIKTDKGSVSIYLKSIDEGREGNNTKS